MPEEHWSRVGTRTAAEVCQRMSLPHAARELLLGNPTPAQFLEGLVNGGDSLTAVRFLAHALPRREAVWWACLCADIASKAVLPALQEQALIAAVRWVLEPTESNRHAAAAPGRAAGLTTAAGNAALAAFYSGGSVNPPHEPIKPPGPAQTAQAVARAVLRLVGAAADPGTQAIVYRQFLALGAGIAREQYRWTART